MMLKLTLDNYQLIKFLICNPSRKWSKLKTQLNNRKSGEPKWDREWDREWDNHQMWFKCFVLFYKFTIEEYATNCFIDNGGEMRQSLPSWTLFNHEMYKNQNAANIIFFALLSSKNLFFEHLNTCKCWYNNSFLKLSINIRIGGSESILLIYNDFWVYGFPNWLIFFYFLFILHSDVVSADGWDFWLLVIFYIQFCIIFLLKDLIACFEVSWFFLFLCSLADFLRKNAAFPWMF